MAKKKAKVWDSPSGAVITPAFEFNGVQYYEIKDMFSLYAQRAMDALAIYEIWNKRVTDEYLRAHIEAMKEATTTKFSIPDIIKLYQHLEERMNFVIPTEDIILEMAAVKYFDGSESPMKYDREYCKEKVKTWKLNKVTEIDFFLLMLIKDLTPSLNISEKDLDTYLKVIHQISDSHLNNLLLHKSSDQQKADIYTELNYQKSLQRT